MKMCYISRTLCGNKYWYC